MVKVDVGKAISTIFGYVVDAIMGPSIAAVLDKFIIERPSELLVAFIYLLGFALSGFRMWTSVKNRKIEFLEKMVLRKEKKDGAEMEGGIIDSNSVGMTEWVSKI